MEHVCKKCGFPLVRECKNLIGLVSSDAIIKTYRLKYQNTYVCPELQKPFRWLSNSHTRLILIEYD